VPPFKESAADADHGDARHAGAVNTDTPERTAPMSLFMSWARSTFANFEHAIGHREDRLDRILVGVVVLLAVAVVFLFTR
jgi:hypothetical protein